MSVSAGFVKLVGAASFLWVARARVNVSLWLISFIIKVELRRHILYIRMLEVKMAFELNQIPSFSVILMCDLEKNDPS